MGDFHLSFSPLFPDMVIAAIALIGFGLCLLSLRTHKVKAFYRLLFTGVLMLCLLQPQIVKEKRTPLKDVVLIAQDKSASMDFGHRHDIANASLSHLQTEFKKFPNLDVRTIDIAAGAEDETKVFDAVETALSDVPPDQRGGIIILSDGQIADIPSPELLKAPLHLVLSGSKKDRDRQIRIINAPGYGVVDETVSVKFRIEDQNMGTSSPVEVTLVRPDGKSETRDAVPGEDYEWPLAVTNAGQNAFELSTAVDTGELSPLNNSVILNVQGVRNRLHVLLVSGEPYPGARMWRDILNADPGVDLVHFTILRSPDKVDMTPNSELSLIAFPFEELFERKLKNFDLIIMDRFGLNTVLPDYYFANMRDYVLKGGALLEINGPDYSTPSSIYQTSLGDILPGVPNGEMLEGKFKPAVTALGKTHPVTSPLAAIPQWGSWLQQSPVTAIKGDVLMTGLQGNPLLILSRTGEGRVAQMTSDQIWLWSRGYENGGPTNELLKRTIHWLMKEPELDEKALDIKSDKDTITIRTRDAKNNILSVTTPDRKESTLTLSAGSDGWLSGTMTVTAKGIYKFSDGEQQKLISVGDMTKPEFTDIITSDKKLLPSVKASGGGIIWAEDKSGFDIRYISPQKTMGGTDWIGLRRNGSSNVAASETKPLLPPLLFELILLLAALGLWYNESRVKKS